MNEIEKIADKLEEHLIKSGAMCSLKELCPDPSCKRSMELLRDLRGIKVVLPKEIIERISTGHCPTLLAGFNSIRKRGWAAIETEIAHADTTEQAIVALAEKITKEHSQ